MEYSERVLGYLRAQAASGDPEKRANALKTLKEMGLGESKEPAAVGSSSKVEYEDKTEVEITAADLEVAMKELGGEEVAGQLADQAVDIESNSRRQGILDDLKTIGGVMDMDERNALVEKLRQQGIILPDTINDNTPQGAWERQRLKEAAGYVDGTFTPVRLKGGRQAGWESRDAAVAYLNSLSGEDLHDAGVAEPNRKMEEKPDSEEENIIAQINGIVDNIEDHEFMIGDLEDLAKDPKASGFYDKIQKAAETLKQLSLNNNLTNEEKQIALNDIRNDLINSQSGNSLIGATGSLMAKIFRSQPASTEEYLAYINSNLQKHNIIPKTYAAGPGAGFSTLSVFIPLWKAVRNIAYLVMVLFFVAYGFMMMFRINLGQKTAITIQLAIPKLIFTLIAITFSYAIVGLVFDLMWVIIYFVFNYLGSQHIIVTFPLIGYHPLLALASGNLGGMISSFLVNFLFATPAAIIGIVNLILGGPSFFGLVATALGVTGYGWIIMIIIFLGLLISYGKLFFKLLEAFVTVIIYLITGPLILLGNALPGNDTIGTWFRNIVANVSVFPVTMIFLLLSYIFMAQPLVNMCSQTTSGSINAINTITGSSISTGGSSTASSPCEMIFGVQNFSSNAGFINNIPLIAPVLNAGTQTHALPWGFAPDSLMGLVGVILIFLSAKYVDIVRDALKVPPFKYGASIGEALKMGVNVQDKWANDPKGGYRLPFPKYTGGITNQLQTTQIGTKVKPVVDALTQK